MKPIYILCLLVFFLPNKYVFGQGALTESEWNEFAREVSTCKNVKQIVAHAQRQKKHCQMLAQLSAGFAASVAHQNRDFEDYEKCFRFTTAVAVLECVRTNKVELLPKDWKPAEIMQSELDSLTDRCYGFPAKDHPIRLLAASSPRIKKRFGLARLYEIREYRTGELHKGKEIAGELGKERKIDWVTEEIPVEEKADHAEMSETDLDILNPCFVAARASFAISLCQDESCKVGLEVVVASMLGEPSRMPNDCQLVGAPLLVQVAKKVDQHRALDIKKADLLAIAAGNYFHMGKIPRAQEVYIEVGNVSKEHRFIAQWGETICELGIDPIKFKASLPALVEVLENSADAERKSIRRATLQIIVQKLIESGELKDLAAPLLKQISNWQTPNADIPHAFSGAIDVFRSLGNYKLAQRVALSGLDLAVKHQDRISEKSFLVDVFLNARNHLYFSISWQRSNGTWQARNSKKRIAEFAPAITDEQKERVANVGAGNLRYGMLSPEEDVVTVLELYSLLPKNAAIEEWVESELAKGNAKPYLKLLYFEWFEMPYMKYFKRDKYHYRPNSASKLTRDIDFVRSKFANETGNVKEVFEAYEQTMISLFQIYNSNTTEEK